MKSFDPRDAINDRRAHPNEDDALKVAPVYNIQRSGNLIETATLNNVAAFPNCRLWKLKFKDDGIMELSALDDYSQVMKTMVFYRGDGGFHEVVPDKTDDE